MNPTLHAVRVGLARGRIEFVNSLRTWNELAFYLFVGVGVLAYLLWNRNEPVEGTDLLLPAVALPSILGAMVAFGAYIGPMYALSVEREDGTLLRAKAVPRGITGYVVGQVTLQSATAVPLLLVLIVPSLLLFDIGAERDATAWLRVLGVAALGMFAVMPIAMVVGALIKSPSRVGMWGMLPMVAMFATSGIVFPVQDLWGGVQPIVQVFPMYWLGLGMRAALLPPEAAALELGGSWWTLEMFGVLGAWALLGLLLAPVVLRRMARRESGAAMEQRRQAAMQRGPAG